MSPSSPENPSAAAITAASSRSANGAVVEQNTIDWMAASSGERRDAGARRPRPPWSARPRPNCRWPGLRAGPSAPAPRSNPSPRRCSARARRSCGTCTPQRRMAAECGHARPLSFHRKRSSRGSTRSVAADVLAADAPIELLVPVINAPLLIAQAECRGIPATSATPGSAGRIANPRRESGRNSRCGSSTVPAAGRRPSRARTNGIRCACW